MSETLGIDFGTTNSATVGIDEYGMRYKYGDGHGQPYPSVIAIDKMTGEVRARGRTAWNERERLSRTCEIITSVKTVLGTDKSWICGNKQWKPENVATEILRGLRQESASRTSIEDAYVAIPVGFSPTKRRALREAANEAGIKIAGFISEPTAAVYWHYKDILKWEKVAVFDWGGGTLDIAVVELNDGSVNEIATSGISLGGDDIDRIIARWAHKHFLRNSGLDLALDQMPSSARDDLVVKSEAAKRALSLEDEASIFLYEYGPFGNVNVSLDADTFSDLVQPQLDQAIAALERTLKEKARMSPHDLGCILMVGGSSKLQGLYEKIQATFDCEVIPPDPEGADWDIASGTALLHKERGDYVVSQNIGVVLADDTYFPLIKNGDVIDYKVRSIDFGLVEDTNNARFIFAELMGNRGELFDDGHRRIGYLDVPAFGFCNEPIRFDFRIDENLLLTVSALSRHRNQEASATWEYEAVRFAYRFPRGSRPT